MKKTILALSLLLLMVTFTSADPTRDSQTLSVSGAGIVQVEPDTAVVRLGVEVSRKTAQDAQADNSAIMEKIMGSLNKQGIAREKVQTAGYNIWPEMKYEPGQPPRTTGYRCTNQVNVTVEELGRVSRVIDAGIAAGANTVQGIQFFRKNDAEFKKLALDKAVKEAAGKAQAIAQAAGLKLKGISRISEAGAAGLQPMEMNVRALAAAGAGETPVSPGLLEVRGSVTITYRTE